MCIYIYMIKSTVVYITEPVEVAFLFHERKSLNPVKPPAPGFLFTEADLSDQAKEPSAAPGGA